MPPTPARTFDEVQAVVEDVEGWMTPGQAKLLWTSARSVPPGGTVVEIGSFRGRSMIVLASAANLGVDLVAIDPHAGNDRGPQEISGFEDAAADDHQVFLSNLASAGVGDRVRHVRKFSNEALTDVPQELDLLYIDGAHRFGPARDDIRSWSRKLKPGADMLIHDSFSSVGVTGALVASLFFGSEFRYLGRSESMTHYRRDHLTTPERGRNAARQMAQLPWFLRNVVIKTLIVAKLGRVTRLLGHDPQTWPY
ncbi:MAG: class I SAM-dependent methyltransferase [Aquihabitans sp.]